MTEYSGISTVTNKNIRFFFTTSFNDDKFKVFDIALGVHERDSLNKEVKRIVIKEVHFTE